LICIFSQQKSNQLSYTDIISHASNACTPVPHKKEKQNVIKKKIKLSYHKLKTPFYYGVTTWSQEFCNNNALESF
jgi:hypothetical protein